MDRFKNKYRISSARLQNWDYGSNGLYFITICTSKKEHFFGEIENEEMRLNALGLLAEKYWTEIPTQFPFVELGSFVIMPNHTHGILIIDKNANISASFQHQKSEKEINGGFAGDKNPMFHDNISRIIRWYKGRCSFEIHKIQEGFAWQSRFHEHIIRNQKSFETIQSYIVNNPAKWAEDKFYGL